MSFLSSIAGGAFGGLFTNATNSLNAFHDFESDSPFGKFIDPAGAAIGSINQRAAKKQNAAQLSFANSLAGLEYQYQKQAALEMPSLMRKGFEDAGYNALLALGNTGGATSAVRAASSGASEVAPRGNAQVNPLMMEAMQTAQAQREEIKEKTKSIKLDRKLKVIDSLIDGVKTVGTIIAARHLAKNYRGAVSHSAKAEKLVDIPLHKLTDSAPILPVLGAAGTAAAGGLGYLGAQLAIGKAAEKQLLEEGKDVKLNPNAARGRGMYVTPPKRPTSKRKHN